METQIKNMNDVWNALTQCIERMKGCEYGHTQTVVNAVQDFNAIANEIIDLSIATEDRIRAKNKLLSVIGNI